MLTANGIHVLWININVTQIPKVLGSSICIHEYNIAGSRSLILVQHDVIVIIAHYNNTIKCALITGNKHFKVKTTDSNPVLYSHVYCSGSESSIIECSGGGINYLSLDDCTNDAVYINCEGIMIIMNIINEYFSIFTSIGL